MNKIIKSTVKWNQPYNTADYSFASVILNAVRNCLAVLMLILSALFMAGDVYTEITI